MSRLLAELLLELLDEPADGWIREGAGTVGN